jgi:sugar lactone lactonase YvrE
VREVEMDVLFRADSPELRFLPEGPYPCGDDAVSWVAIQHSQTSATGSLNVLNLKSRQNTRYFLPGRPGFAFASTRPGMFVVGLERCVQLFDSSANCFTPLSREIDADVSGTIVNDGVAFDGGLVFGCKDVNFKEKKAGLYLFRASDGELIRLRNDQICSNGKIIAGRGDQVTLYDIDTPTKTVVRYTLDVPAARLSKPEIVIDLRSRSDFPDGMVATPDGGSAIISFYNPNDVPHGETVQFSLSTGEAEAVWKTPKASQATCPQLVRHEGKVKLVVTTAIENMSADRQAKHLNSGCLFIADTPFDSLPETPVYVLG